MLTGSFVLGLAALGPAQAVPERVVRPLTTDDAIAVLPFVKGRVVLLGDLDSDGSPELATSGVARDVPTIDVYSALDGKPVRRLWEGSHPIRAGAELVWDAGGDVDADGVPDLLIGLPRESSVEERRGAALVVSGATGEVLHRSAGVAAFDAYGSSVAFVGDLDHDGHDDYVVGCIQVDADIHPLHARLEALWRRDSGTKQPAVRRPGDLMADYQEGLSLRSDRGGQVVARSGRDGRVIWRATGKAGGHAFGSRVQTLGDLDGDGTNDLLAQCDPRSAEEVAVLSGSTGRVLVRLGHEFGPVGSAGDLDGDGTNDLFLDSGDLDSGVRGWGVHVVSGATLESLCKIPYPDWCGDYGMTASLGDLDGDGFDELAVGEPNYNLPGAGERGPDAEAPDLSRMTLAAAVALPSQPRSVSYESGCLLVVSGRTRAPIWGLFGRPGSHEGIGFHATAIPDVSGDGFPDLVVAGAGCSYVLPGPGGSGD